MFWHLNMSMWRINNNWPTKGMFLVAPAQQSFRRSVGQWNKHGNKFPYVQPKSSLLRRGIPGSWSTCLVASGKVDAREGLAPEADQPQSESHHPRAKGLPSPQHVPSVVSCARLDGSSLGNWTKNEGSKIVGNYGKLLHQRSRKKLITSSYSI